MKVLYGNTWLASGGMEGAYEFTIDGKQLNEIAEIFRATQASQFPRYNRNGRVAFKVTKLFNSESDMLAFVTSCLTALPSQALLVVYDEPGTSSASLANAVVEQVHPAAPIGHSVVVEYVFNGGLFTSQQVTIPNESDVMKRGSEALTIGDVSKAVSFAVAFGQPPGSVTCSISAPSGGGVIESNPDQTTITAAGFTAVFGAAIPATGYYLNWEAVL